MVPSQSHRNIAIIGGGIAGLAVANLCLRMNPSCVITLYEKNSWLGGKLRRLTLAGQTVDIGPSIFTIPRIWESFRKKIAHCDPEHPLPSLDLIELEGLGQFVSEAFNFSLPPADAPESVEWQRYVDRHGNIESLIVSLMLSQPRSLFAAGLALKLLAFYRGRLSVASVLQRETYLSNHLREVITIHSLNAGVTPHYAFNLYASLPAVLAKSGVFIPAGGMYELVNNLVQGLQPFAKRLRICTSTSVSAVDVENRSIQVEGADQPPFDLIVNALDYDRFLKLTNLENTAASSDKYSCSAAGFYLVPKPGVDLNLKHAHTVLMPSNFDHFVRQLDDEKPLDSTMSFLNYYAAGSSVYPSNTRDVFAFLLTVPADGANYTIDHPLVQREFARAAKLFGWRQNLSTMIDHVEIVDPKYLGDFGSQGGSIYGRALPWQQQGPRQHVQHQDRSFKHLFHVGASVYPGGGVPAILAGVQSTATLISTYTG